MFEPIESLAFSMHANKGAYALLLGSGISRAAGIMTGWEVMVDLINKLATLKGLSDLPDSVAWYRETYKTEPTYSQLFDDLSGGSREVRQKTIQEYFVDTDENGIKTLKKPTKAHRAIARLIKSGAVNVIITTNFDRLLEMALTEEGVPPATVLSTSSQVEGAQPLQHLQTVILKVHGDYLETSIKNTVDELKQYDEPVNQLLDRIFDEYGLVVSGWSGESDTALREAIERTPNRRFSTYWAARGEIGEIAQGLVQRRGAQIVAGKDADSFFSELAEKVEALEEFARPHPLSVDIATVQVERFIQQKRDIDLHNLVHTEIKKLQSRTSIKEFPVNHVDSQENVIQRIHKFNSLLSIPKVLFARGCYWERENRDLWWRELETVAIDQFQSGAYSPIFKNLQFYPALVLLYAGGIAALAAGNYPLVMSLMTQAKVRYPVQNKNALILQVNAYRVFEGAETYLNEFPKITKATCSDFLYSTLIRDFTFIFSTEEQYREAFDRFEYLLALIHRDLYTQLGIGAWAPIGSFAYRWIQRDDPNSVYNWLDQQMASLDIQRAILGTGCFERSLDKFKDTKREADELFIKQLHFR